MKIICGRCGRECSLVAFGSYSEGMQAVSSCCKSDYTEIEDNADSDLVVLIKETMLKAIEAGEFDKAFSNRYRIK